jgi:hypothetical protein
MVRMVIGSLANIFLPLQIPLVAHSKAISGVDVELVSYAMKYALAYKDLRPPF